MSPLRYLCLVAIAAFVLHSNAQAQSVTVTDLGTLGGLFSGAIAINDAGDVVGSSTLPAAPGVWLQHATRWVGGNPAAIEDLGTLCGVGCPYDANSNAWDINDNGQVVGESEDAAHNTRAFIWDALTGMHELPPLPGHNFAIAYGINNAGHVVGTSSDGFTTRAVRWLAGVPNDLGSAGIAAGGPIVAQDINDAGKIVGWYWTTDFHVHAFAWEGDIMADLDPGNGCGFSQAFGVNVFGHVSGHAAVPFGTGCPSRAARWAPSFENLGALPAENTVPHSRSLYHGINDAGQVAGLSWSWHPEAVLFSGGSILLLGALPSPPGAYMQAEAFGINNHNQIVGYSSLGSSVGEHAVLFAIHEDDDPPVVSVGTPTPELWPPNGALVPVAFMGTIIDEGSGIESAAFSVVDEYGRVQPSGSVEIAVDGSYLLVIPLEARRDGSDRDGRLYTLTITVRDSSGNVSTASTTVVVLHDRRR